MPVFPPIRVNGNAPVPDGTEANSTFAVGSTVALTLASTVGIESLTWQCVEQPHDASAAFGNANPVAPFNTTFGPLNGIGTYLLKATANGIANWVKEIAITVPTPVLSRRVPARAENGQWSGDRWWHKTLRDLIVDTDVLSAGGLTLDKTVVASPARGMFAMTGGIVAPEIKLRDVVNKHGVELETTSKLFNVKAYGADSLGLFDSSTVMQNAINDARAAGGRVFVPEGTYLATGLDLTPGGAGVVCDGVILEGASRSRGGLGTVIRHSGASGTGPILKARRSHSFEVRNITFDGNNTANHCVQITSTLGDILSSNHWGVEGCTFFNARISNLLLGENVPVSSSLDGGSITNCYFKPTTLGARTETHIAFNATEGFGIPIVGCLFYGQLDVAVGSLGFYPRSSIKSSGGHFTLIGGVSAAIGKAAIELVGVAGFATGSFDSIGHEAQSYRFLYADNTGGAIALRNCTVTGGAHADITGTGSTESVFWKVAGHGGLVLTGFRATGNINVDSATFVQANGVYFDDVAGNFTGTQAYKVRGTWTKYPETYSTDGHVLSTIGDVSGALADGTTPVNMVVCAPTVARTINLSNSETTTKHRPEVVLNRGTADLTVAITGGSGDTIVGKTTVKPGECVWYINSGVGTWYAFAGYSDTGAPVPTLVNLMTAGLEVSLSAARHTIVYADNPTDAVGCILPPLASSNNGDLVEVIMLRSDPQIESNEVYVVPSGSDKINQDLTHLQLTNANSGFVLRAVKTVGWMLVGSHNYGTALRAATIITGYDDGAQTPQGTIRGLTLSSAAVATIATITPPDAKRGSINAVVIRVKSDNLAYYRRTIRQDWKKIAGVVTMIGTIDYGETAAVTEGTVTSMTDPIFTASGGNILVQANGRAAETWRPRTAYDNFIAGPDA